MKRITTLLSLTLLLASFASNAQIFWVENFESGSTSGALITSYGGWTLTVTGTEGADPNPWYVSCAENGHTNGVCGTACVAVSSTATRATLHIGSAAATFGDNGASYDAGGLCGVIACPMTDRRAESPVINCTGHTGITLSFNYIENGDGTNDDGSVYYYNGSSWALLVNTPKTTLCSGQGTWTHYSIALPASANNNPNVKIGFRWVNNDDGTGTDPSFAVDSVALSTVATTAVTVSFTKSATTVCEDSCITFTSTSTGTIDSIRWSIPGVTLATPTVSPMTACFNNAGAFPVKLYAYHGGIMDSSTSSVTINPAPHPVLTQSGHTLTVVGTYGSYSWSKNDTAIAGATSNSYTYTVGGIYQVTVDSGGCKGMSAPIGYGLGVAQVSGNGTRYAVAQSGSDAFTLYASFILTENIDVNLYDATGRLLMRDIWQAGSDKKQYNIGSLSSGIYVIRLGNSSNSAVLKWIKQ